MITGTGRFKNLLSRLEVQNSDKSWWCNFEAEFLFSGKLEFLFLKSWTEWMRPTYIIELNFLIYYQPLEKIMHIYKIPSQQHLDYCLMKWLSTIVWGFPDGSAGKESACNVGDLGLIPGFRRFPGEGKSSPLQYSDLENSMDCIVHGVTKSWTRLSDFHFTSLHTIFWPRWNIKLTITAIW